MWRKGGGLSCGAGRESRLCWLPSEPFDEETGMSAIPEKRMSAEEFLAWAECAVGRYELLDGEVFAQAAERAAHVRTKTRVRNALESAIRRAGARCHAMADGMAVRIDERTVFEPDAHVYCGPELPDDALLSENPIIVVEVISPSTGRNDALGKLEGYFRLPSVKHYVIVEPKKPLVIHHARGEGEAIATRIFRSGVILLDPPGLSLDLAEVYGAAIPDGAA
jgi:Uma2 family endonuclease